MTATTASPRGEYRRALALLPDCAGEDLAGGYVSRPISRGAFFDARPIPGFDGYLVTRCGKVLGSRTNSGVRAYYRELKPSHDAKGYAGLTLCGNNGSRRKARVHRLVAEAFIENHEGKPCVRHLDGNPRNNLADNLAWGTYVENEADKRRHGTYDARRNGKLTEGDRAEILRISATGVKQSDIAKAFSVSRPTITRLLNGSTWG